MATFAEPFYRRAMLKLGWQLVPAQTIQLKPKFHIKFDVDDLQGTSAEIKSSQFYNHFPGNRECVTKAGLCRNLWVNNDFESETKAARFFPRCYDLSDLKQTNEFVADFNQTAVISILKLLSNSIVRINPVVLTLVEQLRRTAEFSLPRNFKKQLKRNCFDLDSKNYPNGGLIGSEELRMTYNYCKSLLNQVNLSEQAKKRRRKRHKGYDIDLPKLLKYQTKLVEDGVPNLLIDTYDQVKIVKLCQDLMDLIPQSKQIDGVHNIWIVKPSYNSRGVGIYCTRQLSQIITENKKLQQKVVQKYIERPFLVTENRKFDLRQWVLVNSWEPLDVCVFSSAYLKICSSSFDLSKLDDANRHLSNFSINKKTAEADEIVMSSLQFEEFIRTHSCDFAEDFTWKVHMLPKIQDLIWRTLKSVQHTQEQRGNCFEVFGFDIVLDHDLQPWLIEVNLSPACSERTPWLTKMLDESSLDLLTHIQQKILIANPSDIWAPDLQKARKQAYYEQQELKLTRNLNPEHFYETNKHLDRWIRLQESINEIKLFNRIPAANEVKCELSIMGFKADLKYERRLIKNFELHQSIELIQRIWRGFKGRRIFRHVLEQKYTLVIQRHVRMWFAKRTALNRRQNNGAKYVQRYLRCRLAQMLANRMKQQRLLEQKTAICLKVQSHFRRHKAISIMIGLRRAKAAIQVLKVMKGYLARKNVLRLRARWVKAIQIQRFYRKRFRVRAQACKVVQKHIRGLLTSRRVQRLVKITKGVNKLLHVFTKHFQSNGLVGLRSHAKAICIQKNLRRMIQRHKCLKALRAKAQSQLQRIFRARVYSLIKVFATDFRHALEQNAQEVQRYLRGAIARKKAIMLRVQSTQYKAATVVQKYMRGYLAIQDAENFKLQIGAAIMIQGLWRGYMGRKRFRRILERNYKQVQRELAKEQRAAEKQAREDYDPSNDNLLQIFGIMKKQSKQKLPKLQPKDQKKKGDKKKKPNKDSVRASSNNNKIRSSKQQLVAKSIEEVAQYINKRRRLKKSKIKEKLFRLQANISRRSALDYQDDHSNLHERSCDSITRVDQDEQYSQISENTKSQILNNEIKFLPQPTSRLSMESVPVLEIGGQKMAALKLVSLSKGPMLSQRSASKDDRVIIVKKSIETSMELVGRGSSVAKTVMIRKDPSNSKIPVWAANAIKACESPKVMEKPSVKKNGHQVLEKVFRNGAVKYKVFNMRQRMPIEQTTKIDLEQTMQTEVSRYILDNNRPSNQSKVTRNNANNDRNQTQLGKEKSQTLSSKDETRIPSQANLQGLMNQAHKTKTFAQNLLEMLEHQTKNSIEAKKAYSQEKKPLMITRKDQPVKSPKIMSNETDLRPNKVNSLLNAYEVKKTFAPVKLSPNTQEAVTKLNSNMFQPKKPKHLPPFEGVTPSLAMNDTGKKCLEPIDQAALSKEALKQKRQTDDRMDLGIVSKESLHEKKGFKTREGRETIDLKSHNSSKGLMSYDSQKSEFATNYEHFKIKRFSKANQLIKSSEQIVGDMQKQQKERVDTVVQAHNQYCLEQQKGQINSNLMLFEAHASSQSNRAQKAQAIGKARLSQSSSIAEAQKFTN